MNIWYLSAHDQPRGRSSRTYDFSRELVKRGHQVTMFTNGYCHWTHVERLLPGEQWRIEEIDGIRVVWLRTIRYSGNGLRRGLNMLSNARRCLQVARILADRPDVVIGPSVPLGTGWAAARIAKAKGAAFVFEVRDVWPIAFVDNGWLSKKNPVYHVFRHMEKSLYRRAQRISSALPYIFQHVAESGSDPAKVTWIPNGVNFGRFSGLDAYDKGERRPLVVMSVSGFGAATDGITLVRAANILQQQGNRNFQFVFVGNGVKRPECQQEAARYGLRNIEFRDSVEKAEVPRIQMESDILVANIIDSTIYRFGLNLNKIYDYFASGRPIIFSGKAANDPVVDAGAGFSVPPEDPAAMAAALERMEKLSREERIDMGRKGRRYVEAEFDIEKLAERMEQLLFQAIKDKGL